MAARLSPAQVAAQAADVERRLRASAALSERWADPTEAEGLEAARAKAVAERSAKAKARRRRSSKSALQRAANQHREGDLDTD